MTNTALTDSFDHNATVLHGQRSLEQALTGWSQIRWVDETDSTNAQLLLAAKTARQLDHWPRLLGTEYQTHGRGRAGRPWMNKPGGSLMFSCGFLLEMPAGLLVGMAPALGIAACQALRAVAGSDAERLRMKWPNDIMLDDHKLAGILVESRIMGHRVLVVVGMGLNLFHAYDIGPQIGRNIGEWASLKDAQTDKFVLATRVAQSWQACLDQYNEAKLASLVHAAKAFDYLEGQAISVLQDGHTIHAGKCLGIQPDGALQLRLESGRIETICVGDISVRPTHNLRL